MLKKLYKHEYYSLFRSLLPLYLGLFCLALIGRMLYLFDSNSMLYSVTVGFSAAFYIIGILALFVVETVIIVTRFYKNLLGGEGYLTLTLPFTPTQHIVCKLLCAVSVILLNLLAVFLSLLILGAGSEVMDAIFHAFKMTFHFVWEQYSAFRILCVIAEIVIWMIAAIFQSVLMFYTAMAIGQQFKSKIGGAILSYICMSVALEVIRNLFGVIIIVAFDNRLDDFFADGIVAVQMILLLPIIGSLLVSVACFFATRYFLTKRLNLE